MAYGTRTKYGARVKANKSVHSFFSEIADAILSFNTIIRFECIEGIYYIDWLEIKDKKSVVHYDALEVYEYISFISDVLVMRRMAHYSSEDAMFNGCVDVLDSGVPVSDWNSKSLTVVFHYMKENETIFMNWPKKLSSDIKWRPGRSDVRSGCGFRNWGRQNSSCK